MIALLKSRVVARNLTYVTLIAFHTLVVVLGILSMGFQLLASRLLNPHFGSSIIVWAWLISTFLLAFSLGSMLGGWISCQPAARRARLQVVTAPARRADPGLHRLLRARRARPD